MSDNWLKEMIYTLLNEADIEVQKIKDSDLRYDIGFRDGIKFITCKLESRMRIAERGDKGEQE